MAVSGQLVSGMRVSARTCKEPGRPQAGEKHNFSDSKKGRATQYQSCWNLGKEVPPGKEEHEKNSMLSILDGALPLHLVALGEKEPPHQGRDSVRFRRGDR